MMLAGVRGYRSTGAIVALVLVTVGTGVLAGARPTAAAPEDAQESISSYDVRMDVNPDGSMRVTETIRYDFGSDLRHGVFRRIKVRVRWDDTRDRLYPIEGATATMDERPEPLARSTEGAYEVLRVGDPDSLQTGEHTYVIGYTVRGALNAFPDRAELYWNAIGTEWSVPIRTASARVTGPAVTRTACYAGPTGSRQACAGQAVTDGAGTFRQAAIGDGAGLTVVVAFPRDAVPGAGPILAKRPILATMFLATPAMARGGLLTALLAVGAVLLAAWLVGRDRRTGRRGLFRRGLFRRAAADGDAASTDPVAEAVPGAAPMAQTEPPDGIRPGRAGALLDGKADVVDVIATIVDLAVRGHLRISETSDNWRLTRLTKVDRTFLPYERMLFKALFAERRGVWLSNLRYAFRDDLDLVRERLDADLVSRGWYRRSPDRTRRIARLVAVGVLLAAVAVTVVLGLTVNAGLIGLGLVAGAVTLLGVSGRFRARTPRGAAMADRVRAFRQYLATAGPTGGEDDLETFSRYLPYAMVFGLADRWVETFKDLAAPPRVRSDGRSRPGLYWYTGLAGWTMAGMHGSMHRFTSETAETVTAVAPSTPSSSGSSGYSGGSGFSGGMSSGGYSGGGAGGGGGGSW